MRKKIVAGNWKMNTLPAEGVELAKAVGEMDLFMGAQAVGGEKLVVRRAVNRKCPAGVVEADHILLIDVIRRAGAYPFSHVILR